jgi:hypothetical protein
MLLKATSAQVEWESAKKRWGVHIQVGAEVIKRALPDQTADAGEESLRQQAVTTARDEGYELTPENVTVAHGATAQG